jgi:lysophosphatidate acyltransferase
MYRRSSDWSEYFSQHKEVVGTTTISFSASSVAYYALLVIVFYVVIVITLASAVAVLQEAKIWKPKCLPALSFFGGFKVFLLNEVWMSLCLVGSIWISLKWILTAGKSDIERDANCLVEANVSKLCLSYIVGNCSVEGLENLPPENQIPAPVYVANHASQIDVAAVYFLGRRIKWIAKESVLYIPGVGPIMYLGGHVLIQRKGKNKKSVSQLFERSNAAVRSGIPMFFFPQGTKKHCQQVISCGTQHTTTHNNTSLLRTEN